MLYYLIEIVMVVIFCGFAFNGAIYTFRMWKGVKIYIRNIDNSEPKINQIILEVADLYRSNEENNDHKAGWNSAIAAVLNVIAEIKEANEDNE